jgi:hypothetical protein
MIKLNEYVVRDASNNVDVKATQAKFKKDLAAFVSGQQTGDDVIGAAVNAAFDELNGVIATLTLVSMVASKLNLNHEFPKVVKRVKAYLNANKDAFKLVLGQGGGWERVKSQDVAAE